MPRKWKKINEYFRKGFSIFNFSDALKDDVIRFCPFSEGKVKIALKYCSYNVSMKKQNNT